MKNCCVVVGWLDTTLNDKLIQMLHKISVLVFALCDTDEKTSSWLSNERYTLREKCPNTKFFLVRIFPFTLWISEFTQTTGKYGPEKTPYLGNFHTDLP